LEGWNAKNYLQATLGIKKKNPVLEIKEVPGARLVQLLKLELLQKALKIFFLGGTPTRRLSSF
jgi:hypothetical protein